MKKIKWNHKDASLKHNNQTLNNFFKKNILLTNRFDKKIIKESNDVLK